MTSYIFCDKMGLGKGERLFAELRAARTGNRRLNKTEKSREANTEKAVLKTIFGQPLLILKRVWYNNNHMSNRLRKDTI